MKESSIPNVFVSIYLTNQCQIRCKHCYANSGTKKAQELGLTEIKQLAGILDKTYNEKVRIILTGGEPTLREDFREIVEMFCDNPKFEVLMFSNGAKIPECVDLLRKYDVPGAFTLYGTEKTHDAFAQKRGAFQTLITAIKLLDWSVRICVHRGNLAEAEGMAQILKDLGRYSTDCARPVPVGRAKNLEWVSDDEFRALRDDLKKEGLKVLEISEGVDFEIPLSLYVVANLMEEKGFCSPYKSYDISSVGKVFANCCFGIDEPKFFVGDIRKDSWEIIQATARRLKLNFGVVLKKFGKRTLYHPMDQCIYCVRCWKEL